MPLPADTDATTPKYLRDKYAIVGVGETTYTRGSGKTTRAMGTFAVRAAMLDAGLKPGDRVIVDGVVKARPGSPVKVTVENAAGQPASGQPGGPSPMAK